MPPLVPPNRRGETARKWLECDKRSRPRAVSPHVRHFRGEGETGGMQDGREFVDPGPPVPPLRNVPSCYWGETDGGPRVGEFVGSGPPVPPVRKVVGYEARQAGMRVVGKA